jgi:hypothetical protein
MATIDRLFLVTKTRNKNNAGTDAGSLDVTINIDGEDIADIEFDNLSASGGNLGPDSGWLDRSQAGMLGGTYKDPGEPVQPFDSTQLTNSSIRVGIRSDDAWAPENIFLFGNAERGVRALAIETDINKWESTDASEGKLTLPLRLVSAGSSSTVIQRVMLIVYTGSGDSETDGDVVLDIRSGSNLVLHKQIHDTEQDDFEAYTTNWHIFSTGAFTRGEILSNGSIELSILNTDAWIPKSLFVFGLDTASGRPNEVVSLVNMPYWNLGALSTDSSEGKSSVALPVM